MILLLAALFLHRANTHVVFTPIVSVPAGDDSTILRLEVEHGYSGYVLRSFRVQIAQGVQIVRPGNRAGYVLSAQHRALPAQNWYVDSDGGLGNVTTVIDSITWTNSAVLTNASTSNTSDAEIDVFELQITLGCVFDDANTNSLWKGNYTLWFYAIEYLVAVNASVDPPTRQAQWTASVSGNQTWLDAKSGPAPYVFIDNWDACTALVWFGDNIPARATTTRFATAAQLQSALLEFNSTCTQMIDTYHSRSDYVSVAALVVAIFSVVYSSVLANRISKLAGWREMKN